jgi:hypothetical protein
MVAAQAKAWIYDRSIAGIACSNPAGGIDVCLLYVLSGRSIFFTPITLPEEEEEEEEE